MENFKEMTKRDAQISLNQELLKLRKTSNLTQEKNELIDKELEGFQRLFSQYLAADVAAPIHWEKIEKLPQGSVSTHCSKYSFFVQNSTLISRENCRFFVCKKLLKMLLFWTF